MGGTGSSAGAGRGREEAVLCRAVALLLAERALRPGVSQGELRRWVLGKAGAFLLRLPAAPRRWIPVPGGDPGRSPEASGVFSSRALPRGPGGVLHVAWRAWESCRVPGSRSPCSLGSRGPSLPSHELSPAPSPSEEITACRGNIPLLFLIPDDGAPNPGYADGWLKAAFVPRGKPRGPPGGFPKQSPVPEPGPDARGAGGAESSPASQLSARTEAPATRTGPGGWKVAWEDGRYSTGLSHLLTKIMKTAAREADGEPVHRGASQQGSRLTLPVQPGGTEATHTTGAPGVEDEGRATEGPVLLKYCLALLAAALVVSMLAATITCCLLLRRWRQRNRRLAAADGAQRDVRGHSLPSDGRPALLKGPGSWR